MNSRLDRLSDHRLITDLAELSQVQREFNNAQPVSGKSGLVNYLTQTGNTWDATGGLNSGSPYYGGSMTIDVLFEGDRSQAWPIVIPVGNLYLNGTTEAAAPTLGVDGQYRWTDGTNMVVLSSWPYAYAEYRELPFYYKWSFNFSFFGSMTYYFKFSAVGSCPGTLSFTVGEPIV